MREEEIRELFEKYEQGTCTPQEAKLLEEFLNSFQNDEETKSDIILMDETRLENKIFANIRKNIAQSQSKQIYRMPGLLRLTGIAASFLFLLGLAYAFFQNSEKASESPMLNHSTKSGQRIKLKLSDGTQVILNAESTISYPKIFSDDAREIKLEGEAYFEVAKDVRRPLRVQTKNSLTEVLGTQFNVKDYPEDSIASVSLLEGSVEVNADNNKKPFLLQPGEQWNWNKNLQEEKLLDFDPIKVTGWKDNILIFDELRLVEAIPMIERHFGVEIILENQKLGQCRLNLRSKNYTLGQLLQGFFYSGNIKYEIVQRTVYLRGEGCI